MESIKALLHLNQLSQILVEYLSPLPFFLMVEGKQKANKNRITEVAFLALFLGGLAYFQNSGIIEKIGTANETMGKIQTTLTAIQGNYATVQSDLRVVNTRLQAVEKTLDRVIEIKPRRN